MTDSEPKEEWHLDKRVPISIIFAIVAQTVTFVGFGISWKSDVDHRIGSLEKEGIARSAVDLRLDQIRSAQENRITILEQKFDFISQSLQRIERATVPNQRP